MKKILSFILPLVVVLGILTMPLNVQAATATSKAGVVSVTSGWLNVRRSASTSSDVVATLNKGSYITLISVSGDWWRVEYGKGQYGYCHKNYIDTVAGTPATVAINSGTLNVRSGPDTSYVKIGSLTKGETVIVLSSSGLWRRVLCHGTKTGYVSSTYLSSMGTSQGHSAVSLNVPKFKQTDSRWANVKIGLSGKTFAQIGCATTAIAMMESYRTGTTIYPDAMARKLRYTSSGNVYWPSNYKVVTSSSSYLSKIYNLLKQGKPVLLGAKNFYGGQHWVVVTGFTGGTLTASNFTINDPGVNRTTLQQFLNSYPNFYKYFYY